MLNESWDLENHISSGAILLVCAIDLQMQCL